MDSDRLKVEAMCWLRYGKRIPIVCTEVGRWNCDLLGLCDTMSIEVEVKTSKADLQREFSRKTTKHWVYTNATDTDRFTPNYLYFFVPEALGKEASDILAEKAPKAGVAAFTETNNLAGNNVAILRKATKLRDGPPSPQLLRAALARMSSELCGSKQIILQLKSRIIADFDDMVHGAVMVAAGAVGSLDCEEKEIDLDLRAAQLAMCVEGKIWSEITDQERWRTAARKWLEVQAFKNKEWFHEKDRD